MEGNAVTIDFEVKLNDQGDVDDNGEQTINVRAYLR